MITNKYFLTTRNIPTYIKYLLAKKQSGGRLPEGYQELEYIESNGNQYIIIPYRANNKTKLFARYMQTGISEAAAQVVFGVTTLAAINNANYGIARVIPKGPNSTVNRVAWGGNIIGSTVEIGNAFRSFDTWYEIYFNLNKIYINDTLVGTSTQDPAEEWQAQYDFGIFIRGGNSVSLPFTGRISTFYCTENGRKTVNLIPALRTSDNKPGMYDTVTDTFFVNQGTGEFIYDVEIPNQYQKLEYIESTDESYQTVQYIDTGVKGDLDTKAEIDFEPTGNLFQPFGANSGSYVKNFCIKTRGSSIGTKINIGIGDYLYNGAETTNKRYNISMSYNDGIFIDGVLVKKWTNISPFETDRTLPVFCFNYTGRNEPMKMKLYNLKIYKENVLVRDFIPALRKSDSKPRTL